MSAAGYLGRLVYVTKTTVNFEERAAHVWDHTLLDMGPIARGNAAGLAISQLRLESWEGLAPISAREQRIHALPVTSCICAIPACTFPVISWIGCAMASRARPDVIIFSMKQQNRMYRR